MASPLWVAVGSGGARVRSEDGEHWQEAAPLEGEAGPLRSVAYGDGRFVAVGGTPEKGAILESADGKVWKPVLATEAPVEVVVFGNGRFVAASNGQLFSSRQAGAFQRGERLKEGTHLSHGAAGDTEAGFRYVFIGEAQSDSGDRVAWRGVTDDGARWAHSSIDAPPARDVAYGAGVFVTVGAVGLVEISHDGETWAPQIFPAPEELQRIVWTGTKFLAQGERLWNSPDGVRWAPLSLPPTAHLAWADERSGWLGFDWQGKIVRAVDGRWSVAVQGSPAGLASLCANSGR